MDKLRYSTIALSIRHVDTVTPSQFKVPTDKSGNALTQKFQKNGTRMMKDNKRR